MEKPCAAKVDIELGGVVKVKIPKSNQFSTNCFCVKNHVCEIAGCVNVGWCLGEAHPPHPLHVAGKKFQSSTQVIRLKWILKWDNSFSNKAFLFFHIHIVTFSTKISFPCFQSYILCVAHRGGEGDKCMGAHLPQDNR